MIKWCPGQNCGKAVQGTGAAKEIVCNCGCNFCFKCGEESHFPITCKEKNEWLERCGTQGGNAQWILENTKKCFGHLHKSALFIFKMDIKMQFLGRNTHSCVLCI